MTQFPPRGIDTVREGVQVLDDILTRIEKLRTPEEAAWQEPLDKLEAYFIEVEQIGEEIKGETDEDIEEFNITVEFNELEALTDVVTTLQSGVPMELDDALETLETWATKFRQWLIDTELEYDRRNLAAAAG